MRRSILLGQSAQSDSWAAVKEFFDQVAQSDMGLVIFFCSSHYDLSGLGEAFRHYFGDTPVIGCTTAGELGPKGYLKNSLSGASFASAEFTATAARLPGLKTAEIQTMQAFAHTQSQLHHQQKLNWGGADVEQINSFAVLLVDGISQREDALARALYNGMPNIPLVGGSAGDNLAFKNTWIYHEGQFHTDCALLLLMSTHLPVATVKSQHFVATSQRMVVTAANTTQRTVLELNGLPAAEEYARLTGVAVDDLDLMRFAASPVVVMINGKEYVRSIQRANPDGSLSFYCAIEEGLVFRVAQGVDMLEQLEHSLVETRAQLGQPQVLLAFDCVLRKLEMEQIGNTKKVENLVQAFNTVGFNSYGEQYRGVHVNQTFTGLAIGQTTEGA